MAEMLQRFERGHLESLFQRLLLGDAKMRGQHLQIILRKQAHHNVHLFRKVIVPVLHATAIRGLPLSGSFRLGFFGHVVIRYVRYIVTQWWRDYVTSVCLLGFRAGLTRGGLFDSAHSQALLLKGLLLFFAQLLTEMDADRCWIQLQPEVHVKLLCDGDP